MPAQSKNLAFGHYYVTWAGYQLGWTEGPVVHHATLKGQTVQTDKFGDSDVDAIYTGLNLTVDIVLKEWSQIQVDTAWPVDRTATSGHGASGVIGRSMWDMADYLILTAKPGTPAASIGPKIRTYYKAIREPETTTDTAFGTNERDLNVSFKIFPIAGDADGYTLRWFTDTAP